MVVATAVNSEGRREIIGMDVGTSEDGAFWLAFLRSLVARGLGGVELVVSDAHQGLRDAIATVFGGASWQRCRTHFMTNLLTRVPRSAQPWVATMVRTIYQQPSPQEVHAQLERVIAQLQDPFPQVASRLDEAGPDVLGFEIVGEAADGLEAVSITERLRPNILLLDLSMPKLHGIEVIKRVKTSSPATKIVVLSIHDSDIYKTRAAEAGASGYVVKSAGSEEVITEIRQMCD